MGGPAKLEKGSEGLAGWWCGCSEGEAVRLGDEREWAGTGRRMMERVVGSEGLG